jgi:hypothetical protein
MRKLEQSISHFAHGKPLDPARRDFAPAKEKASELAIDRPGCISIVAQVRGEQRTFTKRA